jgi:CMP-N-acetylneuraminic acid synthetase/NAD(P)-dependent dehydrogenase (short-subunit alcohol dehydrogenase family)
MNICAIVPIKHISTRVPGKNYRDFNGLPLFQVILNTLLSCNIIQTIVIDTNSELVKGIILDKYSCNSNIIIYDRPEDLWAGDVPTNVLLENVIKDLELYNYDFFLQTHVTNPLLSINTINKCIETFIEKQKDGFDSLFTVKKLQTRLYTKQNNKIFALNHNPEELIPTQDLEPIYDENSCVYIFTRDVLFKKHHRIGFNPYIYVMNDIESSDIDTETDFLIAKSLHKEFKINETNNYVLITGVYGEIGNEIAKKFKQNKWRVIGIDIQNCINHEHVDYFYNIDISNKTELKKLILDDIPKITNKIDCIINNAAIQICKPIYDMSEEEWELTFDCNIKPIFLISKYALPLLMNSKNANIINIGSVHATSTSDKIAAYAATKSSVVGLTRNLAIELGKFNIRVNVISPGAIDTSMLRKGLMRGHVGETDDEDQLVINLGKKHLLGNVGKPHNVSELVMHIINNSFLNGGNLVIDGGATIKLSTE